MECEISITMLLSPNTAPTHSLIEHSKAGVVVWKSKPGSRYIKYLLAGLLI